MKKNYWKGSYTVEAAVVVTITTAVLASLILCAFYIHDRAALQGIVCEAAAAGSNFAAEKERREAVRKLTEGLDEGRFLGSRGLEGSAATGSKRVMVSWEAKYPMPGFAVRYLSQGELPIRQSWTSKIVDPADAIRKIKGAGELLTGGND